MENFSLLSDNSQFSSASAVYNVGRACRCIAPVLAEVDRHHFLAATTCVRQRNQIHLIEYDDTDNVVSCKRVIDHPDGEVWGLFPSPVRKELFFVIYTNTAFDRECALLSLDRVEAAAAGGEGGGETVAAAAAGVAATTPAACPAAFRIPAIEGFGQVLSVVWKPMTDADDAYGFDDEDDAGGGDGGPGAAAADTEGAHTLMTVYANGFQVWDVMVDDAEGTQLQPREEGRAVVWEEEAAPGSGGEPGESPSGMGVVTAAAWDPHHKDEVVLAVGGDLVTFNVDTLSEVRRVRRAHDARVTSIDFNPNKPWAALSADCTGRVRFWDLRKAGVASAVSAADGSSGEDEASLVAAAAGGSGSGGGAGVPGSKCLKVLKAHQHWVTAAQYNPAHDQLVLTCSTDQSVRLWRVSSISSAPLMELDDAELALSVASGVEGGGSESDDDLGGGGNDGSSTTSGFQFPADRAGATAADVMVKDYAEHEDSVYAVAWSACESWVFASVSHAGRVIVSSVPSSEKYKILL